MPLPAVALEVRTVFPPAQNEVLPLIAADGFSFTITVVDAEFEHPLQSVAITETSPAEATVMDGVVAVVDQLYVFKN